MLEFRIQLINKLGLHARASAKFVATAAQFQSQLLVTRDQKTINGKSIMAVMSLGAAKGCELILQAQGPDEVEMGHAMQNLIERKFDEAE